MTRFKQWFRKGGRGSKGADVKSDKAPGQVEPSPHQIRFQALIERLKQSSEYKAKYSAEAPYGLFAGRPIIGERTRINGGIHPGLHPREAIVVDEEHGLLYQTYMQMLVAYVRIHGKGAIKEAHILDYVTDTAEERLPLNPSAVDAALQRKKIKNDQKVALDFFLRERAGVERHQILLVAYLIEKLLEREVISGSLFFDLQSDENGEEVERLIFTTTEGAQLTYDPGLKNKERELREQLHLTD